MAEKKKAAETEKDDSSPGFITVKSTLESKPDGGDEVVLFEKDDRHPGGEAFVAGDWPVKVFPTPRVTALIREERLIEV